jgi:hypothetical protein
MYKMLLTLRIRWAALNGGGCAKARGELNATERGK